MLPEKGIIKHSSNNGDSTLEIFTREILKIYSVVVAMHLVNCVCCNKITSRSGASVSYKPSA